jgi:hypothetical protein
MSTTASATPFLDPIQQQIQQHELLKQLNPILSMPMATKFDQIRKIKKLVKNKRNQNNNLANNFL